MNGLVPEIRRFINACNNNNKNMYMVYGCECVGACMCACVGVWVCVGVRLWVSVCLDACVSVSVCVCGCERGCQCVDAWVRV